MVSLAVQLPAPNYTAPAHGILTAATVLYEDPDTLGEDKDWRRGGTWVPELCNLAPSLWRAGCVGPDDPLSGGLVGAPAELPEQPAFGIDVTVRCTLGGTNPAELRKIAVRAGEALTPVALEQQLWDGTDTEVLSLPGSIGTTGGDAFAPTTAAVLGTGPLTPVGALAALTTALGRCAAGSRGIIHAPAGLVDHWLAANVIDTEGARLVTRSRGDSVAAYSAASDHGPRGQTADLDSGRMWAYATGPIIIRLGPSWVAAEMPTGQVGRDGAGSPTGAFNHRTNDVSFTVRRDGLFLMDPCCVFAVEVSTIP